MVEKQTKNELIYKWSIHRTQILSQNASTTRQNLKLKVKLYRAMRHVVFEEAFDEVQA